MDAMSGALCGNCEYHSQFRDDSGDNRFHSGDIMGLQLKLDEGSLHFFRNGASRGPGYAAGSVTGPVAAAVQMFGSNDSVRL
jgi:hypothetical protein